MVRKQIQLESIPAQVCKALAQSCATRAQWNELEQYMTTFASSWWGEGGHG